MKSYFDISNIEYSTDGFGLFSVGHFAWLAIGALFIAVMCRLYRKSGNKKTIRIIVAAGLLAAELARAVLYYINGMYTIERLPLHLCGLSVYIILIHCILDNDAIWQYLYAFCFPGAVFAIVFPDWDYYPLFNILTSFGFEIHILIVTYIVMQLCERKPDIRCAPRNLLIMLLLAVPVYIFNMYFGTNYMFLNFPETPLTVFSFLGRPLYLIGYIPLIAVCWLIMYLPFRKKKDKRNRP